MRSTRRHDPAPACGEGSHLLWSANLWWRTPTIWEGSVVRAPAADAAAQERLGWTEDMVVTKRRDRERLLKARIGAGRPVTRSPDALRPTVLIAVHPDRQTCVGAVMFHLETGTLGGYLAPGYRGRGLGEELFSVGAAFVHHHLGIESVRAGTDPSNVACVRALRAANFVPDDGPAAHTLPNGRVVAAEWFEHRHPAPSRCPAMPLERKRTND